MRNNTYYVVTHFTFTSCITYFFTNSDIDADKAPRKKQITIVRVFYLVACVGLVW